MRGSLIYIMGPSGSGKDTLIEISKARLADRREVTFTRRYITRDPNSGGEDFIPLSRDSFDYLESTGHFLFSWRSHGLSYGIARQIEEYLADGQMVIVNGSRAYLARAMKSCPDLKPVLITAEPEILAARLRSRGRESAEDQSRRLNQPDYEFKNIPNLHTIDNSGELETAAGRFCSYLREELNSIAAGG